jgi:hypothetical protein
VLHEQGGAPSQREADWRLVAIATVAVLAFYAVSVSGRTLPLISQDELGFISQSQFLAGRPAVNMGTAPYYHVGYSLLLVPIWWLTSDPILAYKGFVLVNAALAALVVPLLVDIGRMLGFRRSAPMVAAAAVVAVWPSYFYVAHYAWSEALFRLLLALHVWALLRLTVRPEAAWAALFALSATALYATHPRALLLLVAAPAVLVVLWLLRRIRPGLLLAVLAGFALATAAAMLAMGSLHETLWGEGGYSTERALLARLLAPQALLTALTVGLGQLWYQLASSLGLCAIGLWFMVRRVGVDTSPAQRVSAGYMLVIVLAVGLASLVQMLDPQRVDHVAYGRYVDGVSILPLWLGLCWLVFAERDEGQRVAALASIAVVLAAGVVLMINPQVAGLTPVHPENVAGVGWIFRTGSTPQQFFGVVSLILGAVAALLLAMKGVGRVVVAGLLAFSSSVVISAYLSSQSRAQLDFLSADAAAIEEMAPVSVYWTDEVRNRNLWSYHLQYVLGTSFIDAREPLPSGAGVLADRADLPGLTCTAVLSNGLFLLTSGGSAQAC